MPAHRSGPRPIRRSAARPATSGKRRAGARAARHSGSHAASHAASLAGHLRGSRAGRAVVAATSAVAVVSATAVLVGASAADPAVAAGQQRSVALHRVQQVVTGTADATNALATTATLPTHADLGVQAASSVAPSSAPTVAKPQQIKQRYGIDVSWPQCNATLPTIQLDFAVIGLTDGHADSVSPCFAEQVAWARANHLRVAVYVVPNSPGAAASTSNMRTADPTTPCTAVDAACPSYAVGVQQAQHAMAAAAAASLPRTGWWLDVEESTAGTLWGDDLVGNAALLKGWVDTLRAANLPVGAYSTHGYWTMITGGWDADLPQWVPVGTDGITDAQQACAEPFTSGPVVMTQWLTGPYDGNQLCPTTDGDPMARAFTGRTWATPTTAGVPALLTTPVPHPEAEQAQAEQDAATDCTDGSDSDQPSSKHRTSGKPKKGKPTKSTPTSDACSDDQSSTAGSGTGKTPKTKGQTKGHTKGQTTAKAHHQTHHAQPKAKPKGKHHKG